MPGVSKSCMLFSRESHCFPLVTPGRLPVWALFFPVIRLIRDDLPTLGTPTIIRRKFFLRSWSRFFLSCSLFSRLYSCFTPSPLMQFIARVKFPCSEKKSVHFSFSFLSDRSLLLRTINRRFSPTISSMMGFLLETGILASITSMTISTILRFS